MVKRKNTSLRVIELFAGVGGFRLGLEGTGKNPLKGFNVVWSNQWEPGVKKQYASDIYIKKWGNKGHSNSDISLVPTKKIPDHDLLVGGFPCQDYSVARVLSQAEGIVGKKGVLWWEIQRILKEKGKNRPSYLLLENVDRLLKSPAEQRGRDFAIMLASLSDLGYIVEWRVINAADYGMPQRRRRVFILGYKEDTSVNKIIKKMKNPLDWVTSSGTVAKAFPIEAIEKDILFDLGFFRIDGSLVDISESFKGRNNISPFVEAGMMVDRKVYCIKARPRYGGRKTFLADILLKDDDVPRSYYVDKADLAKWQYLKGSKNEYRRSSSGFEYNYTEGPLPFPDPLDRPSRTIVTGEGGAAPSRFKHIVKTSNGDYRRLTPIELERLNMFPDDHTEGAPDIKRAFLMGNALVVGVVERLGRELIKQIRRSKGSGR